MDTSCGSGAGAGVGLLLIGQTRARVKSWSDCDKSSTGGARRVRHATAQELCAAFRARPLRLPNRFGENFDRRRRGDGGPEADPGKRPRRVALAGGAGRNGLVFTAESVESLADALARLAASAELRRQLGEAGRAAVEAHYTWDHVARAYLDLFAAIS